MYADTIELFRKYMGEKNFQRLKYYDTLSEMWEATVSLPVTLQNSAPC